MADALLGKVVGALTPLMKKELDLILGMDGERQKLEHAITSIGCVLQDAERKQFSDEAVRGWLAISGTSPTTPTTGSTSAPTGA